MADHKRLGRSRKRGKKSKGIRRPERRKRGTVIGVADGKVVFYTERRTK